MKKVKIKGFTLIECLIALAILGIGALVMAQIYANVSRINQSNHNINTSLAYQMKYVEEYTSSETVVIFAKEKTETKTVPDPNDSTKTITKTFIVSDKDTSTVPPEYDSSHLTHVKIESDSSKGGSGYTYSYTVDMFVLLSRDANDVNSSSSSYKGYDEENMNLRYKYITGHAN